MISIIFTLLSSLMMTAIALNDSVTSIDDHQNVVNADSISIVNYAMETSSISSHVEENSINDNDNYNNILNNEANGAFAARFEQPIIDEMNMEESNAEMTEVDGGMTNVITDSINRPAQSALTIANDLANAFRGGNAMEDNVDVESEEQSNDNMNDNNVNLAISSRTHAFNHDLEPDICIDDSKEAEDDTPTQTEDRGLNEYGSTRIASCSNQNHGQANDVIIDIPERIRLIYFGNGREKVNGVKVIGSWDNYETPVTLSRRRDGSFRGHIWLTSGTYEYRFIIDDFEYDVDPNDLIVIRNEEQFNQITVGDGINVNSVVHDNRVRDDDMPYSVLTSSIDNNEAIGDEMRANGPVGVTVNNDDGIFNQNRNIMNTNQTPITYSAPGAQRARVVYVVGSWDGYRNNIELSRQPDDTFTRDISLQPGTYYYRFIVDGQFDVNSENIVPRGEQEFNQIDVTDTNDKNQTADDGNDLQIASSRQSKKRESRRHRRHRRQRDAFSQNDATFDNHTAGVNPDVPHVDLNKLLSLLRGGHGSASDDDLAAPLLSRSGTPSNVNQDNEDNNYAGAPSKPDLDGSDDGAMVPLTIFGSVLREAGPFVVRMFLLERVVAELLDTEYQDEDCPASFERIGWLFYMSANTIIPGLYRYKNANFSFKKYLILIGVLSCGHLFHKLFSCSAHDWGLSTDDIKGVFIGLHILMIVIGALMYFLC